MTTYTEAIRGREHELPVKWDGHPVTWGEATAGRATVVCTRRRGRDGGCRPGGDFVCTGCGAVDEAFDVHAGVIAGLVALILNRCLACGHDQVLELEPGTSDVRATWDLDETDYGGDGSVPPEPETLW